MHALLPRCLRALRALCEASALAGVRDPAMRERRAIAALMRRVLGDVAGRDPADLASIDPLAAQEVLRDLGDPSLTPEALGEIYEQLLAASTPSAGERRRGGRHYTPRPLARDVVRHALEPLLTTHDPRALRVCDPAMGGGVFLLEALRQLAEAAGGDALGDIARGCVFGLDLDPLAVEITRVAVAREAGISPDDPCLVAALRAGDGLRGPTPRSDPRALPWTHLSQGFDVVVGNPPWVSYAGRAAQPLDRSRRAWYARHYASFRGYRNLQGLFVERATTLGRPGARVGLVLPSSMAELAGYAPVREVFDRAARCDDALPDLGEESFDGVAQPAMALFGTLRDAPLATGSDAPWPLARPDLDDEARALLKKFEGEPFPPETFGERGVQTQRDDARDLARAPDARRTLALREGKNVGAFARRDPVLWCDPARLTPRHRDPAAWRAVDVLIRQTARVPLAARGDGGAFRNTLLAGYGSEEVPWGVILAWLNSAMVRWGHYHRHRDARLGMPQVKVGQLRALPAPPVGVREALRAWGERLGTRNDGITPDEQRALDDLVFDALGLTPDERARVRRDAARWG